MFLKMSSLIGILFVLCVTSLSLGEKYSNKYDNIDVDKILSSRRVLNNYIKCILDEGPCTADGREFRQHIPEAITDNCAKCSDAQMNIIRKTASFIMVNRPEEWQKIKNKYDPEGKYAGTFDKFIHGS